MTDRRNHHLVALCLLLATGLTLIALGLVMTGTFAVAIWEPGPQRVGPAGGPIAILTGALLLATALAAARVVHLLSFIMIAASLALLPLALNNPVSSTFTTGQIAVLPMLSGVLLLFSGACLAIIRLGYRLLIWPLTLALLPIGAVNLFAGALDLPVWARLSRLPDFNPLSGIMTLAIASGLPLLPELRKLRKEISVRPILIAGVLGVLLTVTAWYLVRSGHERDIQERASLLAEQTAENLRNLYTQKTDTIKRLAQRLATAGGDLPPERTWTTETGQYFRDMAHLELLVLLDDTDQTRRMAARDTETRIWLSRFLADPDMADWLTRVRNSGGAQLSDPLPDDRGTPLAAIAVRPTEATSWTLLGVINLEQLMSGMGPPNIGRLNVNIQSHGTSLYQAGHDTSQDLFPIWREEIHLQHEHAWTLTVSEPLASASVYDYLSESLVLFGGLTLTALLMITRLFGELSARQNLRLAEANTRLSQNLRRESQLRETNERIVTFSNDLLCTIDREGCFRFVSPASKRILGYQPEEMEGRLAREFVLEEDWEASTHAARQLRRHRGQVTPQFRNRYRHRDGHLVTIDWKARTSVEDGTLFCIGRDMTAELKAQELAQQREAFFSLTPEMLCILSDNRFLEVNQAFLTVLGYVRGDLVGQSYLQVVHRAFHATARNAVDQLVQGKAVHELEIQAIHQQGDLRWLRLNASMSDGLIYCSARDITREKQVQTELREKEHLLAMAEQIGRLGGWVVDLASGKTVWTRAIYEIHDLSPGDVPDLSDALSFYTPESRPLVEESVRLAADLGLPFDIEARIHTAAGRLRWVRVIGQAVRNEQGEITTLQGAFQDISASKEASEQIRRLAERQSRIFESITDAFFTLDRDWRFTYMNRRCEDLLQRSRSDVLGESLWEAFPETIGTEFEDRYRQAIASGETASFEAYFPPLALWCEVKAYPSEEGLAVYFRSINERKEAEQTLQATMVELERSNRELQDFAFVASHDLQEPLRKIQTFSDRLLRKVDHFDEHEQDYLKRMQTAAGRMQTLIMDLLSYSRVATQAQPFQDCDLNRIIGEVQQDLESAIVTSGAHIEVSPLPHLQGDPSQLRQVMQNLLSNAIKFLRPDVEPKILVYPDNIREQGWTLVVSDNGTGFDPKYGDRLFQPFQRLHSRNEYAGTGIGLAIVRKIVNRHQGIIVADGRPGEGSTFRIHFSTAAPPGKPAGDTSQS